MKVAMGGQQRVLTTLAASRRTDREEVAPRWRCYFLPSFLYMRALLSFALRTCL